MKKLVTMVIAVTIMAFVFGQDKKPAEDILIKANVTITGKAKNAKLGAVIQSDTLICFIDGLISWPDNKYNQKITATGDLYKTPAPAFIQQNDSLLIQGIPVKDSLEYEEKKYKWTLKNVTCN
jgi:hypothetical protein